MTCNARHLTGLRYSVSKSPDNLETVFPSLVAHSRLLGFFLAFFFLQTTSSPIFAMGRAGHESFTRVYKWTGHSVGWQDSLVRVTWPVHNSQIANCVLLVFFFFFWFLFFRDNIKWDLCYVMCWPRIIHMCLQMDRSFNWVTWCVHMCHVTCLQFAHCELWVFFFAKASRCFLVNFSNDRCIAVLQSTFGSELTEIWKQNYFHAL